MMVLHLLRASSSVAAVELDGGLILNFLAVAGAIQRVTGRKLLRKLLERHGYMRTGHAVLEDNADIPPPSMDISLL